MARMKHVTPLDGSEKPALNGSAEAKAPRRRRTARQAGSAGVGIARYHYAVEKLTTTIRCLATDPGDVRERLTGASSVFHRLREEDFPAELRATWRWIMQQLTKSGPLTHSDGKVWRGSIDNTMRRVRKSTGAKIAKAIYDLYWKVSENREYA